MKKPKSDYAIQTVTNALRLLDVFREEEEIGVAELARRLGLHKNNVFRLLATLEEQGYITKRDGKIAQLDGQIRLTHKDIQRLKNRLSEFQITAAAAELLHQPRHVIPRPRTRGPPVRYACAYFPFRDSEHTRWSSRLSVL